MYKNLIKVFFYITYIYKTKVKHKQNKIMQIQPDKELLLSGGAGAISFQAGYM